MQGAIHITTGYFILFLPCGETPQTPLPLRGALEILKLGYSVVLYDHNGCYTDVQTGCILYIFNHAGRPRRPPYYCTELEIM